MGILLHSIIMIIVVTCSLILAENAAAFRFQEGDVSGFIDTTLSSGISVRLEERDHALIGHANGGGAYSVNEDDGNLNYSKGSVIAATNKVTHDIGATYQNFDAFVRTAYFYDPTNLYKKELTPYERSNAGQGFDVLDAYVAGKFAPGDKNLDVRVGKQVLNWGESLFIPGGLSAINAVDLAKLRLPGAEVREALLPSPMISNSYQMTDNLSISNFYIFKFDRTQLDICGTFFATDDVFCEDGLGISTDGFGLLAEGTTGKTGYRAEDLRPSNQGQYGAAIRYLAPQFNDAEFGLYFMNYHNHVPVASAIANSPGLSPFLRLEYLANLQVFGITASTDIQGIAVQGEYSYRPRYPLQLEGGEFVAAAQYFPSAQVPAASAPGNVVRGWREMPVNQLQASMVKAFGNQNPFGGDEWIVAAEAAMLYVGHFPDEKDLRFEAPATHLSPYSGVGSPALQTDGWADNFSWGYVLSTSTTYQNLIKHIELKPRVAFSHDVQGTTPSPLNLFVEGSKGTTLGVTALYLHKWSLDVSYTNYFGAAERNTLKDRDFASLTVKHWF